MHLRNRNRSRVYPKRLYLYSIPSTAQRMAYKYLGRSAKLYPARNSVKKYSIYDTIHDKWVNFGQMGIRGLYETPQQNSPQKLFNSNKGMLGDWKNNKYSSN
jgi:hypothetical protein